GAGGYERTGKGDDNVRAHLSNTHSRRERIAKVAELGNKQPVIPCIERRVVHVEVCRGPDVPRFYRQERSHEHIGLLVSERCSALVRPINAVFAAVPMESGSLALQAQPDKGKHRGSGRTAPAVTGRASGKPLVLLVTVIRRLV